MKEKFETSKENCNETIFKNNQEINKNGDHWEELDSNIQFKNILENIDVSIDDGEFPNFINEIKRDEDNSMWFEASFNKIFGDPFFDGETTLIKEISEEIKDLNHDDQSLMVDIQYHRNQSLFHMIGHKRRLIESKEAQTMHTFFNEKYRGGLDKLVDKKDRKIYKKWKKKGINRFLKKVTGAEEDPDEMTSHLKLKYKYPDFEKHIVLPEMKRFGSQLIYIDLGEYAPTIEEVQKSIDMALADPNLDHSTKEVKEIDNSLEYYNYVDDMMEEGKDPLTPHQFNMENDPEYRREYQEKNELYNNLSLKISKLFLEQKIKEDFERKENIQKFQKKIGEFHKKIGEKIKQIKEFDKKEDEIKRQKEILKKMEKEKKENIKKKKKEDKRKKQNLVKGQKEKKDQKTIDSDELLEEYLIGEKGEDDIAPDPNNNKKDKKENFNKGQIDPNAPWKSDSTEYIEKIKKMFKDDDGEVPSEQDKLNMGVLDDTIILKQITQDMIDNAKTLREKQELYIKKMKMEEQLEKSDRILGQMIKKKQDKNNKKIIKRSINGEEYRIEVLSDGREIFLLEDGQQMPITMEPRNLNTIEKETNEKSNRYKVKRNNPAEQSFKRESKRLPRSMKTGIGKHWKPRHQKNQNFELRNFDNFYGVDNYHPYYGRQYMQPIIEESIELNLDALKREKKKQKENQKNNKRTKEKEKPLRAFAGINDNLRDEKEENNIVKEEEISEEEKYVRMMTEKPVIQIFHDLKQDGKMYLATRIFKRMKNLSKGQKPSEVKDSFRKKLFEGSFFKEDEH